MLQALSDKINLDFGFVEHSLRPVQRGEPGIVREGERALVAPRAAVVRAVAHSQLHRAAVAMRRLAALGKGKKLSAWREH